MKEYHNSPKAATPKITPFPPAPYKRGATLQSLIDKALDPCLRCGARLIRTGGTLSIACPEGRIVRARVCRQCASLPAVQLTSDSLMRRAA
jgi:predicted RNA-binding Zn-ribbon protein involved in translation (DUF1610 family)